MRQNKRWLIFLLFLVLIPKTSFAHAYITNSNPGENSELKQAPKQIEIEFNEQIEEGFHSIKVYNSSGERVDAGKTVIQKNNARIMTAALKKICRMIFTERNGTRYRPTDIRYPASSLSVSEKPAENFRSRHHRKRRFILKRPSTAVFCTPLSPCLSARLFSICFGTEIIKIHQKQNEL